MTVGDALSLLARYTVGTQVALTDLRPYLDKARIKVILMAGWPVVRATLTGSAPYDLPPTVYPHRVVQAHAKVNSVWVPLWVISAEDAADEVPDYLNPPTGGTPRYLIVDAAARTAYAYPALPTGGSVDIYAVGKPQGDIATDTDPLIVAQDTLLDYAAVHMAASMVWENIKSELGLKEKDRYHQLAVSDIQAFLAGQANQAAQRRGGQVDASRSKELA